MWHEVPAEAKEGSGFSRVLKIEAGMNATISTGPVYGLSIFEFNEEVILSVGNSYVQQFEHQRWSDGLQKLISSAGKTQ